LWDYSTQPSSGQQLDLLKKGSNETILVGCAGATSTVAIYLTRAREESPPSVDYRHDHHDLGYYGCTANIFPIKGALFDPLCQ